MSEPPSISRQIAQLEATAAAWKAMYESAIDDWRAECDRRDQIQAERDRLREALREIKATADRDGLEYRIARAALAGGQAAHNWPGPSPDPIPLSDWQPPK